MLTRRRLMVSAASVAALSGAGVMRWFGQTAEAEDQGQFEVSYSDEEWRQRLTPEQYRVLRGHGTERAGTSPLDREKRAGTFHCAGCDLPLFASETKFDSGTGWPSFYAAARQRGRHLRGQQPVHDPHRGPLPALRRPSRPRLRGRPAADRAALLHERRRADLRAGGRPGRGQRLMRRRLVPTLAAAALALAAAAAAAQQESATMRPRTTRRSRPSPAAASGAWSRPSTSWPACSATISGYTGGTKVDPTYEEVSAGGTGHTEAVQVVYDPAQVSYEELLEVFWRNVDPLDAGGQFCDRGEPVPHRRSSSTTRSSGGSPRRRSRRWRTASASSSRS